VRVSFSEVMHVANELRSFEVHIELRLVTRIAVSESDSEIFIAVDGDSSIFKVDVVININTTTTSVPEGHR